MSFDTTQPYMSSPPNLSSPSLSDGSSLSASFSSASITSPGSSACSISLYDDEASYFKAASLTPYELIRLFQCRICSLPLRDPLSLPCGKTLCKTCLPETHSRKGISFPGTPERIEGFACPFEECGIEHARADCAPDVALQNLLDQGRDEIEKGGEVGLDDDGSEAFATLPVANQLLVTTYRQAKSGELKFNPRFPENGSSMVHVDVQEVVDPTTKGKLSDMLVGEGGMRDRSSDGATKSVTATTTETIAIQGAIVTGVLEGASTASTGTDTDAGAVAPISLADKVTGAMRGEADCKVCYAIFYDPVTTACGHTYCRPCLQRSLDIHPSCPLCRRGLSANTYFRAESSPANERLGQILEALWPDQVKARRDAVRAERLAREAEAQCDLPIFVCTVSLPTMPTVLHIFEPRYRLMIQRALQGNRTFGMVLPRTAVRGLEGESDEENQHLPFTELGTLLRIKNVRMFPDGRSLVEAIGMSRFRIVRHSVLDDYVVAKVERYDDISIAEEEAFEASETVDWEEDFDDRSVSAGSFTSSSSSASSAGSRLSLSSLSLSRRPAPPSHLPSPSPPPTNHSSRSSSRTSQRSSPTPPPPPPLSRTPRTPTLEEIDTMSTASLMAYASSTMERKWRRFSVTNRGPQPEDPRLLPWWLAAVLPTQDVAKYRVLRAVSLRERFKICCRWLVELEEGSSV